VNNASTEKMGKSGLVCRNQGQYQY